MASFYADSSVLIKRHITETGTSWGQTLMDARSGNVIVTSRISEVEVCSAFNRRVREGTLRTTDYANVASDFTVLAQTEYEFVEVTALLIGQAQQLLERHPLRAYDAVQLASALIANGTLTAAGLAALTFLAADRRLLAAATAEGLATDNPNMH